MDATQSPRLDRRPAEDARARGAAASTPQPLVVFRIDEQRYALALAVVECVLPLMAWSSLPRAPAVALGVINVHGRVIPVVDVRRRLGSAPRCYGLADQLLIAHTRQRVLALPVDEVVGVHVVVESTVIPAATVLPAIEQVTGIVALADGMLFIHDLEGFLSLDEDRELEAALEARDA